MIGYPTSVAFNLRDETGVESVDVDVDMKQLGFVLGRQLARAVKPSTAGEDSALDTVDVYIDGQLKCGVLALTDTIFDGLGRPRRATLFCYDTVESLCDSAADYLVVVLDVVGSQRELVTRQKVYTARFDQPETISEPETVG